MVKRTISNGRESAQDGNSAQRKPLGFWDDDERHQSRPWERHARAKAQPDTDSASATSKEMDNKAFQRLQVELYQRIVQEGQPVTAEQFGGGAAALLPGFAGVIEDYIFNSSYIPIRQVAQVATLAALSGACGRAYCTPTGKGLSGYYLLVAHSGTGKEGIHDTLPKLFRSSGLAKAEDFCRKIDFVSGPGLQKEILRQPGFLNLHTEFGKKLKGMANSRDAPMQSYRTVLTKCWGAAKLDGLGYSDVNDSILPVDYPALSLLGETTPGAFTNALTADMAEDGFLSRFLITSYLGERPRSNPNHLTTRMEARALAHWRTLLECCIPYQEVDMPADRMSVTYADASVKTRSDGFEEWARVKGNAAGDDEFIRAVYSRAHLKALIAASLFAVADRPGQPQINVGHFEVAEKLVNENINQLLQRQERGEVGNDDFARIRIVTTCLTEYIRDPIPESYNHFPKGRIETMKNAMIVPKSYLQIRTQKKPAFAQHPQGATNALEQTLKSMVGSGYLVECGLQLTKKLDGFRGKAFQIANLPTDYR